MIVFITNNVCKQQRNALGGVWGLGEERVSGKALFM